MDIILSGTSGRPIYEQIAQQIRSAILTGGLSPGEALPSIRALAQSLSVSVITTKRAYEELEREGVIETRAGKGSFVAQLPADVRRVGLEEQVRAPLEEAVRTARMLGMTDGALRELFEHALRSLR